MRNLFLIGTVLVFISCNNSIVFEKYKNLEDQSWHSDSVINFDYTITDTTLKYKLDLNLRHSVNYEYQNLFLFITFESTRDTIELLLADKRGRWFGRGVGDIREVKVPLKEKQSFLKKGSKSIKIEQAMRYGSEQEIINLKFVDAIGISITKIQ
tara:strand:- start:25 stop:486 length:462 start_codon:yes stop_codon:yes gene_type:complete